MKKREIIKKGFSKLIKEDKLKAVAEFVENPSEFISLLKSFWHRNDECQKQFDEFSENTISNFHIPYGVSPNVIINGETYIVPMVIEESSVVAAASAAAQPVKPPPRTMIAFLPLSVLSASRASLP